VRAIAYQQLHAKAGNAILGRLLALYPDVPFPAPGQLLASDPQSQGACGFSAAKLATIRGIAQATLDGVVPRLEEARCLSDAALIERLTTLPGVGRWTVEMFLIYSLERSDILAADDFGVREGHGRVKAWRTRPRRVRCPRSAKLGAPGERWQPGICGGCPVAEY
jgi:DNA-3-methyladenine glycosylase II